MQSHLDLDAYFERIGYREPATPTLDTLFAIHALHPQAIPFENLNPLLGLAVRLDAGSLQQKLLLQRRGGYCYEHNLLFKQVLETIGFRVTGLAARVLLNAAENTITPRTHMLLLVDMDGERWIADVGFGGLTMTAPLRLAQDIVQLSPHEPFRLIASGGDFILQAQVRDTWRALYSFDLQQQFLPDYELASWYLCNHPQSRFISRLSAARAHPARRYALLNNALATHELNGETVRCQLTSAKELRSVLEGTFGITLPDAPTLHEKLEQIASLPAV